MEGIECLPACFYQVMTCVSDPDGKCAHCLFFELDEDDVSSRVTIKTSDMDEYVLEDSAVNWAFYLRQGGCVFSHVHLIVALSIQNGSQRNLDGGLNTV